MSQFVAAEHWLDRTPPRGACVYGTTTLFDVGHQHPDISGAVPKETFLAVEREQSDSREP